MWEQGLAQAVGASNFNEQRTRKAAAVLAARGTCLSSNQVQYSLLYRKPEANGVMEACRCGGARVCLPPICLPVVAGAGVVRVQVWCGCGWWLWCGA